MTRHSGLHRLSGEAAGLQQGCRKLKKPACCTGWYSTRSEEGRGTIEPGTINSRASFCVRNYQKAKYLPADLNAHVVGVATCSAGPGASEAGTSQNVLDGVPPPPPPPIEMPVTSPTAPPTTVAAGGVLVKSHVHVFLC